MPKTMDFFGCNTFTDSRRARRRRSPLASDILLPSFLLLLLTPQPPRLPSFLLRSTRDRASPWDAGEDAGAGGVE